MAFSVLKSICVGATLVVGGCTVGPDYQTPAPPDVSTFLSDNGSRRANSDSVPGRVVVRGADITAQWWDSFGSRPLRSLIEDGLANNPDLVAAAAAVRVSQANLRSERGGLFPVVGAGFDASRQQIATRTLTSDVASDASLYSLHTGQLTVGFVPDLWGGTRRQIEAAGAQLEMQVFQCEGVYLTLTSKIVLAAIEEARLRGQIAETQRIIDLQNELLGSLQRQQEHGQISSEGVIVQQSSVAQSRLLLAPLQKQLDQQRHQLAFLTGRFPSEGVLAKFRINSFTLPRRLPLSLPADLVWQRPDIRAAAANLRASNAEIGVAIANRLPKITLSGNVGSVAGQVAQLFTPGTGFWMVAGSVAHTVFDAGTLESKQWAAEEATNQALAQYRSVVLAAFQNVADVLRALQADSRAIDAASAAERFGRQHIDLIRRQVEQGQVDATALLTAQQVYLQAALALIDARASRLSNTAALFQALGGGWWNRAPTADRVICL